MRKQQILDPCLDIEKQQFDPQKYVTNFLGEHSILDLIKKNNEVQSEIKNFDQEIQSLVFENYSKFISSIETVRKMKNDIFKVDENMKILEESMNKINKLANTIDDSLYVKRDEIQKLETVNKDLQKLNSLCEFPIVLEADLKEYREMMDKNSINFEDIFNKSIKHYEVCFQMLNQFKEEPLVAPIYKDAINKIEEIRTILWNLQNSHKAQTQQMFDILKNYQIKNSITPTNIKFISKKLIQITEDKESVLRNYLKIIKDKFNQQIYDIMQKITENSDKTDEQIIQFLEEKNFEITLSELEQYKTKVEQQTIQLDSETQGSLLWLVNQLKTNIFIELKEEIDFVFKDLQVILNNKSCLDAIDVTIKEIIMNLLQQIAERMNNIKITNIQVNECFRNIFVCIQNTITNNSLVKKQLKTEVLDKFMENVEQICRGQLNNGFSQIRVEFIDIIIEMKTLCLDLVEREYQFKSNIEKDIQETEHIVKKEAFQFLTQFKNKLMCLIIKIFLDLKQFIYSEDQYLRGHNMFFALLNNQVLEFLKLVFKLLLTRNNTLSVETLNIINSSIQNRQQLQKVEQQISNSLKKLKDSKESSAYFILINQFIQVFEKKFIFQVFEQLDEINKNNLQTLQQHSQSQQQQEIQNYNFQIKQQLENIEIPKFQNQIRSESSKNFINYSQYTSELFLSELNEYFQSSLWQDIQDPRDISKEMEKVVPALKILLMELGVLFPDMKRGLSKKGSFLKFESSFNIEMEKIMVKKAHHYQIVIEYNRNLVLITVLKSIFKRIIERVRNLNVISKFAFQQIQIDFYFFIQLVYEMVTGDDEGLVTGFYFEIIESASNICLEPQKIDLTIVESISNTKRNKFKI